MFRPALRTRGVPALRPPPLNFRTTCRYLLTDTRRVTDDHAEGVARGVIGSPHFVTPAGDFFCPSLDINREPDGRLRITTDTPGFDRFVDSCFE